MGRRRRSELRLTSNEYEELADLALQRGTSTSLALRARIVLACSEGLENKEVARCHGVTPQTVGKWRMRYIEQRLAGLLDGLRPGAPRRLDEGLVRQVVAKILEGPGTTAARWSTRTLARQLGMSQTAVSRIWRSLDPQRDQAAQQAMPVFFHKVRNIVGMHLQPSLRVLALCLGDEDEGQGPGRQRSAGTMHVRSALALLSEACGDGAGLAIQGSRPRGLLAFLRAVDAHVPRELRVQLVIHLGAARLPSALRGPLASPPRYQVHVTADPSSWLEQVEYWMSTLKAQGMRCGQHQTVRLLEVSIQQSLAQRGGATAVFRWNLPAHPRCSRNECPCLQMPVGRRVIPLVVLARS